MLRNAGVALAACAACVALIVMSQQGASNAGAGQGAPSTVDPLASYVEQQIALDEGGHCDDDHNRTSTAAPLDVVRSMPPDLSAAESVDVVPEEDPAGVDDAQAPALVAAVQQISEGSTDLSWAGEVMGLKGARVLAEALQSHGSRMEQLLFDGGELGDDGTVLLSEALGATSLHTLVLWDNNIGPKGSTAIAEALRHTDLTTIELANNNVGNPGAKALAGALASSQVQTIGLNRNSIRNKGAKALAEALAASQVHTLRLSHNQIGDSGIRALSAAIAAPGGRVLTTLDIAHNQVGDSGIRALAKAIGNSGLNKLVVSGNAIGAQAKAELTQAWQQKHANRGGTGLLL